jgi:hypothetical protein
MDHSFIVTRESLRKQSSTRHPRENTSSPNVILKAAFWQTSLLSVSVTHFEHVTFTMMTCILLTFAFDKR